MDIDFILNGKKPKKRKQSRYPLLDLFGMKSSQGIIGDIITKPQRRVLKTKSVKTMFGDWDGDGVINGLDCQPRNKNKHRANKMIRDRLKEVNIRVEPYIIINKNDKSQTVKNNTQKHRLVENTIKRHPRLLSKMHKYYPRKSMPNSPEIIIEEYPTSSGEANYNIDNKNIKFLRMDNNSKDEVAHSFYHELRHREQDEQDQHFVEKYNKETSKHGYINNSYEKDANEKATFQVNNRLNFKTHNNIIAKRFREMQDNAQLQEVRDTIDED